MINHSVLTVAGKYIENTLVGYKKEKCINFWINPYRKKEVANIKYGDQVGVFLSGVGLMYVGEAVPNPGLVSESGSCAVQGARMDDVFNVYNVSGMLECIGLASTDKITDFHKLVNTAFSSRTLLTGNDIILNLCLKPIGLSGTYQSSKGYGIPIGNSDGKATSVGKLRFKEPRNGESIVSFHII